MTKLVPHRCHIVSYSDEQTQRFLSNAAKSKSNGLTEAKFNARLPTTDFQGKVLEKYSRTQPEKRNVKAATGFRVLEWKKNVENNLEGLLVSEIVIFTHFTF